MAVDKETVCFVWNGAAGGTANAGGATKTAWNAGSPSDFMSATGAPIATDTECTLGSDGVSSINTRITGSSSLAFDSVVDGTVSYVAFDITAIGDGFANGYYEVKRVDGESGLLDLLDCAYTESLGTCDIWIGGAFDKIQSCCNADIMDATAYTRTCYVRGDVDQTSTISISSGGGQNGTIKWFIGVNDDSTWTPLSYGSYITYDASSVVGGLGGAIFDITASGVFLYGISAYKPEGNSTPASSSVNCFRIFAGDLGGLINCHGHGGYIALYSQTYSLIVSGCVFENSRKHSIYSYRSGHIIGTIAIAGAQTDATGIGGFVAMFNGCIFQNCISVGWDYGYYVFTADTTHVINCTSVECNTAVYMTSAECAVNITNCLFVAGSVVNPIGIDNYGGGRYYDHYCLTDIPLAYSGFKGAHSHYGIDLSDVLTDIDNGDYSTNTNSAVAQQYIIGKGTPLITSLDNPSA